LPKPLPDDAQAMLVWKVGDAWLAKEGPNRYWLLVESEAQARGWRRLPDGLQPHQNKLEMLLDRGYVRPIPGRAQYLVQTVEPSIAGAIPEALASRLPESWASRASAPRVRWYDASRDEWRDAGPADARTFQARADSLFVVAETPERTQALESWPLPPRDPRPPALAIAALCMAATWWLCAWRYRRRKRLAPVGAA